jgi:hypothetical protein
VQQIWCDSGESWYSALYKHYDKDKVVVNFNEYTDIYTALIAGVGRRTIWIGKFDNRTCKGVVVDRRMEIRNERD